MLAAVLDSLDGLSDQEKEHYVEREGKWYLEVEPVLGLALEDVGGLKKTVGTLRQSESSLKKQLEEMQKTYEGIDAEEARNALSKFDEIKNWDGDKKAQEQIEAAKRELVKRHQKEKEDLENQLSNAQDQLTDALVNTKIVEALQKEEGNVELLMPHVKEHVRMVQNAEGRFYPEVTDEHGNQRIGDGDGSPMTIHQYI
jgi:chromosome segregation ATPase